MVDRRLRTLVALAAASMVACTGLDPGSLRQPVCSGLCLDSFSADPSFGIQGVYSDGVTTISFFSRLDSSGVSYATFWLTDPSAPLLTAQSSGSSSSMTWQGSAYTGAVGIAQADLDRLHSLATQYGPILAQIPMQIGIRPEFAESAIQTEAQFEAAAQTGRQRAALLVPWQMMVWYLADVDSLVPVNYAAYPSSVGLRISDGFPQIDGNWPFGTTATTCPPGGGSGGSGGPYPAAHSHQSGTCPGTRYASSCRGACGSNCDTCTTTTQMTCTNGQQTTTTTYDCPTHACCVSHDMCYDKCATDNGCGATQCQRQNIATCQADCNNKCIACAGGGAAGLWQCIQWWAGQGTTLRMSFTHSDTQAAQCGGGGKAYCNNRVCYY